MIAKLSRDKKIEGLNLNGEHSSRPAPFNPFYTSCWITPRRFRAYKLHVRLFAIRRELINLPFRSEQAVNRRGDVPGSRVRHSGVYGSVGSLVNGACLSLGCGARIMTMINRLNHRADPTIHENPTNLKGTVTRFYSVDVTIAVFIV